MPRIGTRKVYYLCRDKFLGHACGRDKLNRILQGEPPSAEAAAFISCDNKLPPSVPCTQNLVGNLDISRPEQVWVSDITYIGSRQNNLYLALVTDAYSKRIMGYDLSKAWTHKAR